MRLLLEAPANSMSSETQLNEGYIITCDPAVLEGLRSSGCSAA